MVFCPSPEMCCNNFQTLGVGQNGRAVCTNRVIIREREALCARELDYNYRLPTVRAHSLPMRAGAGCGGPYLRMRIHLGRIHTYNQEGSI